jgi:predicted transcriptional regulator
MLECATYNNKEIFGVTLNVARDIDSMGKEERKRLVLGLLVESGLHLPPAVIFHNCKEQGATFERRSVDNYLGELRKEGLVEKVSGTKGYHKATEKGRNYYFGN